MFTRWTISNFKSIRDPVTLELAPLTIFSGVNSSGKSTLIQSILLVAQSLASSRAEEALILNGRFLQLGQLSDVCHHGQEGMPIAIGFVWQPARGARETRFRKIQLDTRVGKGVGAAVLDRRAKRAGPGVLETTLLAEEDSLTRPGEVQQYELRIQTDEAPKLSSLYRIPPGLRQQVERGQFSYAITRLTPPPRALASERIERAALISLLPHRLLVVHNPDLQRLITDVEWLVETLRDAADPKRPAPRMMEDRSLWRGLAVFLDYAGSPGTRPRTASGELRGDIARFHRMLMTLSNAGRLTANQIINDLTRENYHPTAISEYAERLAAALPRYLHARERQTAGDERLAYEERLLPPDHRAAVDQLRLAARNQVYYLGPLRDEPRVVYQPPPYSDQWSVGLKGEYTAAVLDDFARQAVTYPLPPEGEFTGVYDTRIGRLSEAVTLWLRRLGLVESIDTEEMSKVGHRLTVNSPGLPRALDLKSVGVGVSQVLPTLVQALLAPEGSVLIFEQPELHLHPRPQAELADFFLGMAQIGKQCLVESHSEQLINRLRRRIVEARQNQVLPLLRLYFAEKEGAATRFREVRPDEYGAIFDWPEGFFDQGDLEMSGLLRSQIRREREALARQKGEG